VVTAYSDGVLEARDDAGEEFGVERLRVLLASADDDDLEALVGTCLLELHAFAGGEEHHDDITLVSFGSGDRPDRSASRPQTAVATAAAAADAP
jgi:sigma-B regulation protein RsbU (phosphoserine phosphatase)